MCIWSFIFKQQKLAPLHVLTVPTGNSSAEQKIQVKVHNNNICVKMVLIIIDYEFFADHSITESAL